MQFTVTFKRIGRHHPAPLHLDVADDETVASVIAHDVHVYALSYLLSRECDVVVELGAEPGTGGTGHISAGMRPAGRFTVEPVEEDEAAADHWAAELEYERRDLDV